MNGNRYRIKRGVNIDANMTMQNVLYKITTPIALLLLSGITYQTGRAQGADQVAARAQTRFLELDTNKDGQLSGRELEACDCLNYDTDGNGIVAKSEFYAGFMIAAYESQVKQPPPARQPQAAPPPPARGSLSIGDRVELRIGDSWYPGVIYAAAGNQVKVNRDSFGRARELWNLTDVRPEQKPLSLRAMTGVAANGPFALGVPVEVNTGGATYRGNIGLDDRAARHYQVDAYKDSTAKPTTDWIPEGQIRRLEPIPQATAGGRLPASVPVGSYVCTMYSGSTPITVGKLRILSSTTYTGFTPDGSGPVQTYTYDAATGSIQWQGGVPMATTIQRSQYRVASTGRAEITVWFQNRRGGVDSFGCER